jgi:hypothetical protein
MQQTRLFAGAIVFLVATIACARASAQDASHPPPAGAAQAGPASSANPLVGAWRLLSIETVRPNGSIIYPFYGKHPEGLIVYDASGWMSVQIASDPKPTLPRGDSRGEFLKAPPSQKAAAADGYYAYYGPYTVDVAKSTVTHHLRDALLPGERGKDFLRQYSIDNGKLTLLARMHELGEDHVRRLVWRKLAPGEAR